MTAIRNVRRSRPETAFSRTTQRVRYGQAVSSGNVVGTLRNKLRGARVHRGQRFCTRIRGIRQHCQSDQAVDPDAAGWWTTDDPHRRL